MLDLEVHEVPFARLNGQGALKIMVRRNGGEFQGETAGDSAKDPCVRCGKFPLVVGLELATNGNQRRRVTCLCGDNGWRNPGTGA